MDLAPSIDTLGGFLALALGFGFIILVHEAGHFFAAKWAGIKVSQFAIGFGPSFLTWRSGRGLRLGGSSEEDLNSDDPNLGETEYCLKILPLGGFVRMLGQDDLDPSHRSRDPRSYNAKSVSQRMVVISAGVVMNLIFAVLFFVIAFMAGVKFPSAVIGGTVPESPAATTQAEGHDADPEYLGLRPGDEILAIDGKEVGDFTDLSLAVALSAPGKALAFDILRPDGQTLTYQIVPVRGGSGMPSIGVQSASSLILAGDTYLSTVQKNAGLQPGMRLIAVDGQPIERFDQLVDKIQKAIRTDATGPETEVKEDTVPRPESTPPEESTPKGRTPASTMTLTFRDADIGTSLDYVASLNPDDAKAVMVLPFQFLEKEIRASGPIEALGLGVDKTVQAAQSVYLTLLRLVQRRIPVEEMRGPVGIADTGTRLARDRGLTYLLYFLGLISVNLAVINFLPIPVVDGGHMVFLMCEGLKGSPLHPRWQILATYLGMALILSVFLLTLFYDTARLIGD